MATAGKLNRLRKPTLGNLVILMGGELAARGFTFLAFAYLARTLGPESYGYIAPAYAVLMCCMLVVDLGFGTLGTREIAKHPEKTQNLVNSIISAQIMLSLSVLALLTIFCHLLPLPEIMVRLLLGFGLSLLGIPFLLNWVFQGRNEMLWYAMPMTLRQLVFLAMALLVVTEPDDVTLLPVAEIIAVISAGLLYVSLYRRSGGHIHLTLSCRLDINLFMEILPIGGGMVIWALRIYLPVVAVSVILGTNAAGLFDVGHRIIMVFHAFLGVYFTNLFPAMSLASHESIREMSDLLQRSLLLSILPSIVLAIVIMFIAPFILGLVYGQAFVQEDSVSAFQILIWVIPIMAWRRNSWAGLITLNQQHLDFRISLIGVTLLICLLLPFSYFYGVNGAAWSMVISELLTAAATWYFLAAQIRHTGDE